jgi:hypothetical protein
MAESSPVRVVRIPEDVFLSRPDLWSREGLEAFLEEQGIDPSRPYVREETYLQLPEAA